MISNASIQDTANRRNLRLLVQLRWVAVGGQLATIAAVHLFMDIPLDLPAMLSILVLLAGWNLFSQLRLRGGRTISQNELFLGLLVDVAALTGQLYLSGGAVNPFVSLFLLQVMLGAVLLDLPRAAALGAVATAAFVGLMDYSRPLVPPAQQDAAFLRLHIQGALVCFVLAAGLSLFFVTRITRNLRERDERLATLRQEAAEQDHILRLGLLAAGAAHELGTPLATLSVILNDWRRLPFFRRDQEAAQELAVMESQLDRCKGIVSGILLSSGELRGEGTVRTHVRAFLDETIGAWRAQRTPRAFAWNNRVEPDAPIFSDAAFKQVLANILDNALEASPGWIGAEARRVDDRLVIEVRDDGPGFNAEMLAEVGKPYRSSKGRPGSGLGLFLVFNVMRKLGGQVTVGNRDEGGARVVLSLPLSALTPRSAP